MNAGGNGHFYSLTPTPSDMLTAEAYAQTQGGHLVAINSAAEQAFLNSTFLAGAGASRAYWIGLNDVEVEGVFRWTTGEPVTYTNWDPGEPNNDGGIEDAVAINWHYAYFSMFSLGGWNDDPIGGGTRGPFYGIVEREASPPQAKIRASEVEICWGSISNTLYKVQYRSDLTTNTWVNLFTNVLAVGEETCVFDVIPRGQPQRFYRVEAAR